MAAVASAAVASRSRSKTHKGPSKPKKLGSDVDQNVLPAVSDCLEDKIVGVYFNGYKSSFLNLDSDISLFPFELTRP